MRWKGRRQSGNVRDQRRAGPKVAAGGLGGILILAALVWLLGGNPLAVLSSTAVGPGLGSGAMPAEREDELAQFVSVVLADTEEVWHTLFQAQGLTYAEPELVLFSGRVESACGYASAAMGPFYCPLDQRIYIDLAFMDDLSNRLGAPGDFAQAYVIAHEVGHHVQHQLGALGRVQSQQRGRPQDEANELSVRLELQADFYAGIWAHHAQRMFGTLEPGDVEEAMRAAAAVGDDRLQAQAQGHIVPDSFTHGTSEQRARWFMRGFRTGDLAEGDTFAPPEP